MLLREIDFFPILLEPKVETGNQGGFRLYICIY